MTFLRNHARRFGIAATARYAWCKAMDRIAGYTPYSCFVRPVDQLFPAPAKPHPQLVYRVVEWNEIARIAADPQYEISDTFLATALRRRDVCMGAFAGERLVAYGFSSARATNIDADFCFQIPSGWMYNFKAYTLPEWRGKRIHAGIWEARRRIFREAGFTHLVALVVATNYPSLGSLHRLGFRRVFGFAVVGKSERRRLLAPGNGEQAVFGQFAVRKARC